MAWRKMFDTEDFGDVCVVTITEAKVLEENQIQELGRQLFALVESHGKKNILLNFGLVTYYSSAGLGKLITLQKMVNKAGGKLVFCSVDPDIYEVFEITQLHRLFKVQKDQIAGLQFFSPSTEKE